MKMLWGKYKGEDLEDIPTDYIAWVLSNTDVDNDDPILAAELQSQLDAREGRGIPRQRG